MSPIKEEAVSIARRLLHTSQGDWLSRYDANDEEWMPARMHSDWLRRAGLQDTPA